MDYLNPRLPIEKRIDVLMKQMTVEEKAGQLFMGRIQNKGIEQLAAHGLTGSCVGVMASAEAINQLQRVAVEQSRLGIPLLFGCDIVHGYSTIFPIPLAEAATWNPELIERCAAIAGREAAAQGIRWTMSPMVDIARDPRWGRIAEGAGEDPYLGMAMAKAMVTGYQGSHLSPDSHLVACVKHFVGYGAAEGGRDYDTTEISERTLREIYLPPFRAALDAGAGTVMSAFNNLNGIPTSANPYTLTQILREEWGFHGAVRADANSDLELINHGVAADSTEAALKAFTSGMDMGFGPFQAHLAELVLSGKVPMASLDESVRRVLRIKLAIGLFEHPYVDLDRSWNGSLPPEYRQTAREAARQAIVLLKNEHDLLPLAKNQKAIAVIGPLADDRADLLGCWHAHGAPSSAITLLEGIRTHVPASTQVLYARGCGFAEEPEPELSDALSIANKADVIILAIGESSGMSGEGQSRSSLDLPGRQDELLQILAALNKPLIVVLMNGRPLSVGREADRVPAVLETWFLGTESGNAIADVLFGDVNPSGKLPVTFPRSVGQVPMYYNHMSGGRPASADHFTAKYQDLPWTPLFPFGFGLSYTTFTYSNLVVQADPADKDSFHVSVQVINCGSRAGTETVQLYIRQTRASVTRPVKQLEGFAKVTLTPGESKTVGMVLTPLELSFYNPEMQRVVEPGPLEVMVGGNSENVITNLVYIDSQLRLEPRRKDSHGNL
jgi:beta-glucosidase